MPSLLFLNFSQSSGCFSISPLHPLAGWQRCFKINWAMVTIALLVPILTQAAIAQTGMGDPAVGATQIADHQLDPARSMTSSTLESAVHQPLPEHYIWTHLDSGPVEPSLQMQYFRRTFTVNTVAKHATLYIAGPRSAKIYLNGKLVGYYSLNLDFPMGIRVYPCDVTSYLRLGRNILAIEAIRGPDATNQSEDWMQSHGEVLAAMLVPEPRGVQGKPLVMTDASWRTQSSSVPDGWSSSDFDDSSWKRAQDHGAIESSINFFQGNADAGMYAWPGYDGISSFLAHFSLAPMRVSHVYAGAGEIHNADDVVTRTPGRSLTVTLPAETVPFHDAPQILIDFGREVTGRLEIESAADSPSAVTVQYGESEPEALSEPYLGVDPVYIPPHGTAFGPKSAFRYAIIRFTSGRSTVITSIKLDGIAYPVKYQGSFESSDTSLNKMWAIGAYTAHLCMQDDIWDASKRDRRRWMGDLDVSGRTIDDVFFDHFLMEDTMSRLIGDAPVSAHVNGIPGYSAFWVTGETQYYLHSGSLAQLQSVHQRLIELLQYLQKDLDERHLFADKSGAWLFVDWSPELSGNTRQSRMATQFEYYAAFRDGAYLLNVLHDDSHAAAMKAEAQALKAAAQQNWLNSAGTFGDRWQPNAYAVLSGVANPKQYPAIWKQVLSNVGHITYNPYIITPYYNYYVVSAMARMGQRQAALNWIRQYWGGMLNEGATSFWEGYDPAWYKGYGFHQSLQADNSSGFFVSLAHGWSSGVTPWLMEQVLGIEPTSGGFATVSIRPDLMDLQWAKGSEPTPHGLLGVDIHRGQNGYITNIDLPPAVQAEVSVPISTPTMHVLVNSHPTQNSTAENNTRAVILLHGPGHYTLTTHE